MVLCPSKVKHFCLSAKNQDPVVLVQVRFFDSSNPKGVNLHDNIDNLFTFLQQINQTKSATDRNALAVGLPMKSPFLNLV